MSIDAEKVKIALGNGIIFVRLEKQNHVVVHVPGAMSSGVRGHLLLEAERRLRHTISPDLEIYLEPKGDLNALRRRLRGIKLE